MNAKEREEFAIMKNEITHIKVDVNDIKSLLKEHIKWEADKYKEFEDKFVAKEVQKGKAIGILIDGTGIGMSIVANKFKGVYAALVYNEFSAKMAKWHNNANVITIGATTTETKRAEIIVDTFLTTE